MSKKRSLIQELSPVKLNWIKIDEQLPEMIESLILDKGDFIRTQKVLVKTDTDHICDNFRVKKRNNEWCWYMDISDEHITHYALYR